MMSVMSQAIQGGVGHHRVWEKGDPVLRGAIACDDDRRLEVSFCYDFVEVLSLGWAEGRESEVIDYEELWSQVFFNSLFPGVICSCGEQEAKEFCGLGKEHIVALSAGLMAQCMGEVALSSASRAIEEDMFSLFDKDTDSQIPDEPCVEFWIEGEIKAFEGLLFLEGGSRKPKSKLSGFPPFDFILNEQL